MDQATHNKIVSFIWGIADDVLRDLFRRGKYPDVILPMCVLRRLDAVLEPTKKAVLEARKMLDDAGITEQTAALCSASGQAFYNTSKFTLRDLKSRGNQQQLLADFEDYLNGFSPNVQDILATLALEENLPAYRPGSVDIKFLRELAKLSYLDSGPRLAKEFLSKAGIHLVFERHLPHTHLDGAAMKLPSGAPVVGLTLRYDRLDNFWFTLFHELAHVALHLEDNEIDVFFDDITKTSKDRREKEADELATEALIPADLWKAAKLRRNTPPVNVVAFAEKLRISPAIPAGRVRFESKDYKVMKSLIGSGKVRPMFGLAS